MFYTEHLSGKGFDSLMNVFILLFCLSHGQSSIERGFRTNKEFEVVNLAEDSLISLRMINDHMRSKSVNATNVTLTKELVASVRSRYTHAQDQKKAVHEVTQKELRRRIIGEEIEAVVKKKKHLQLSIADLTKDNLADTADKKSNMQILGRSNDLRKLAKQIDELDQMERSLVLRKESLP